jgi:hypothetical protein
MHCQPHTHREIKGAKLKPLQKKLQIFYECDNRNSKHVKQTAQHLLQRSNKSIALAAHRQNSSDTPLSTH